MTPEPAEAPAAAAGYILIVDDTPENLAVLARLLRGAGYEVRPVLSGRLALQVAAREAPDLILLDVRMPEMDGYEVCRRFKEDEALKGIPVIFVSAAADTEVKVRAFTCGGVDFVAKPFEALEVLARVRTHLTIRLAERQLEVRLRERTRDLQQASRYARSLIEASPDPLVTISPEGKITDVNRATEEATGLDRSALIDTDFADYFTEPELARAGYQCVLAAGLVRDYPLTIRHCSGATVEVLYNASVYCDGGGRVLGVFAAARDMTAVRRAEAALRRTNRALKTLTECNATLVHATDEGQLLTEMCRIIVENGGYRLAWIGFVDESRTELRQVARLGDESGALMGVGVGWRGHAPADGPAAVALRTSRPQVVQAPEQAPDAGSGVVRLGGASALVLPLASGGPVFGVLTIHSAAADAFDEEEIRLLNELAEDLAYGIVSLRTRAGHERALLRLETSMEETIKAIASTVEMRDPYTSGHQQRVAQLAAAIGRELGLPEAELHGLYLASIVHDLGKLHIPAEILSKPTRLSRIEFELIKGHAEAGYDLLKTVDFPWPIAEVVHQHHERLDGSGYPRGLRGGEILLQARIVAVADVVEAMASHRPYRPARGIEAALDEVIANQGKFYDPEVVAACVRLFREQGFAFTGTGAA